MDLSVAVDVRSCLGLTPVWDTGKKRRRSKWWLLVLVEFHRKSDRPPRAPHSKRVFAWQNVKMSYNGKIWSCGLGWLGLSLKAYCKGQPPKDKQSYSISAVSSCLELLLAPCSVLILCQASSKNQSFLKNSRPQAKALENILKHEKILQICMGIVLLRCSGKKTTKNVELRWETRWTLMMYHLFCYFIWKSGCILWWRQVMSSSWFSEIHQDEESYSTWISCFSFFVSGSVRNLMFFCKADGKWWPCNVWRWERRSVGPKIGRLARYFKTKQTFPSNQLNNLPKTNSR